MSLVAHGLVRFASGRRPAGRVEGEVVPILESSGDWVRVEDNAGARGWAHVADARRLDVPPEPPRMTS